MERFALDEVRPLLRPDCELRFDRADPRLEREPALFEPDCPDFAVLFDREPEFARAISFSSVTGFAGRISDGPIPTCGLRERVCRTQYRSS